MATHSRILARKIHMDGGALRVAKEVGRDSDLACTSLGGTAMGGPEAVPTFPTRAGGPGRGGVRVCLPPLAPKGSSSESLILGTH